MNPLVLAAHGTRDDVGAAVVGRLAQAVRRELPGVAVRYAFVDVRPPRVVTVLADVLSEVSHSADPDTPGSPAVIVPAFLGAGYHVRHDLPRQLADAGLAHRTLLTPLLGSHPLLVTAAADRVRRAGWRPGDGVVLAAAGSRDERALRDVATSAAALGARLGTEVRVGYLASGSPTVPEVIDALRSEGRRVFAASWLLAPGLFQSRLADSGADIVTGPLGVHPAVVRAVLLRYRAAVALGRGADPDRSHGVPGRVCSSVT